MAERAVSKPFDQRAGRLDVAEEVLLNPALGRIEAVLPARVSALLGCKVNPARGEVAALVFEVGLGHRMTV